MKCGLRHWFQLNWENLGRTFIFRVSLRHVNTLQGNITRGHLGRVLKIITWRKAIKHLT